MNPEALQAWTTSALTLASAGVQIAGLIGGWVKQAHSDLTQEQQEQALAFILDDAGVRAALAAQASGQS